MKWCAAAIAAAAGLLLGASPARAGDCSGGDRALDGGLHWTAEGGRLILNGCDFQLKGLNWFGFQSQAYAVGGVWLQGHGGRQELIDIMKNQGINAVRLPISLALALNDRPINTNCVECGGTPGAWEFYRSTIEMLGRSGIVVLIDMHTLGEDDIAPLWHNGQFSLQDYVQGWRNLLSQFGNLPNVLGIDLKNEPHDPATWGASGDTYSDFKAFVEFLVGELQQSHPDFDKLIFVAGIQEFADGKVGPSPYYWGENIEGVRYHPIDAKQWNNKVVYSPHCYGPNIDHRDWFNDPNFPGNMGGIWDNHFGFAESMGYTVVMGEWGGLPSSNRWMEGFADYLKDRCMSDNFLWALNPNSVDTAGLVGDDWRTVNGFLADVMARAQPNPSYFVGQITAGGNTVNFGQYGNPACAGSQVTPQQQPPAEQPPAEQPQQSADPAPAVEFNNAEPVTDANNPSPQQNGYDFCALVGGQCAGSQFYGPTCCRDGSHCTWVSEQYSYCGW